MIHYYICNLVKVDKKRDYYLTDINSKVNFKHYDRDKAVSQYEDNKEKGLSSILVLVECSGKEVILRKCL